MASFNWSRRIIFGGGTIGAFTFGVASWHSKANCFWGEGSKRSTDPQRHIHHKILVVGGGTAGVTVASQLLKQDILAKLLHIGKQEHRDIAVVEPSETHYYQALWSMVGCGLYDKEASARPTAEVMPEHAQWIKDKVSSFSPENNAVTLKSGCKLTYDYLIVACGMQQNWNQIAGLETALKDQDCPVVSTFDFEFCDKTYKVMNKVESGDVLFTMPSGISKTGCSAAQKEMWLWEDEFRKKGVRHKTNVSFLTPHDYLFHIDRYDEVLKKMAVEKGVDLVCGAELVKIDPKGLTATFQDAKGKTSTRPFTALHVVPPQSAPEFLKSSPLVNKDGFVDVDEETLQHKKFNNVFALGDCSSLPTTKSAAAVASQAPVVVHNLVKLVQGKEPTAIYDGYSGCPILVGEKKVLLAEHAYGNVVKETFLWDQRSPSRLFYHLQKDFFPWVYWYGFIRGSWYGRHAFRKPPYPEDLLFRD